MCRETGMTQDLRQAVTRNPVLVGGGHGEPGSPQVLNSSSIHSRNLVFILGVAGGQGGFSDRETPSQVPLSPWGCGGTLACHTYQLAVIEEGKADGLKVQTDLVLSRRLGSEGEAAPRAILMGQKVLEEAASSEHREAGQEPVSRKGTLGLSQSSHPQARPEERV